jgi:hypothetical protein
MPAKTPHYLHLLPDSALPELKLSPFLAILLVEDDVLETWMWDACRWLVAAGCRYALAWGRDGEAWHDAIDDANLEAFDYDDVPPDHVVLSTWHEDEEIEDVFWFAKHRASHPDVPLNATLILHIAAAPRKDELEALYADA